MRILIAFFLVVLSAVSLAHAQDESRAAWQVTRFDITARLPADASADRNLTVRAVIAGRNVGGASGRTFTVRLNPAADVRAASANDATATFTKRDDARAKLQQITINLPAAVAPRGETTVALEYRLPVEKNNGLMTLSPEGSQFLPPAFWYPTPNTPFTTRGADAAPFRLTVTTANGENVLSSGRMNGGTFEQTLNAQPFFVTGAWDAVNGEGEARNISVHLLQGAPGDERRRADELIKLAAAARAYFAGLFGTTPDAPVRLIAVRRGGGFDDAGAILLDASAFRRSKLDAAAALSISDAMARLWIGGASVVRGEGASVLREGLVRHLSIGFLERQFGAEAAASERLRQRIVYATIAKRDIALRESTPLLDTHFASALNKGALVWSLVERATGRDAFIAALRSGLKPENALTLAGMRAALVERGDADFKTTLDYLFDQPTNMDLLVGLPQARAGGEWGAALRNTGSADATANVLAVTERGERLNVTIKIPARDFAEARFRTTARIVRVEVDPEKLYPQIDYGNDTAPDARSVDEALADARTSFSRGDFAGAERAAREALATAPVAQEARILAARAALGANKLDEAEKDFRRALDDRLPTAATLAWGNIGLGEIALRRNQAAEAVKRFDEAARADAEYASTLEARLKRIRAESLAASAPAIDESSKTFIASIDQAIRGGRKADLDRLITPGELVDFSKGIIGSQPQAWQTRVLRTEATSGNRLLADVEITARILDQDQKGTSVLVLTRVGGNWKLTDVQLFEVR
ncbi:MAG: hypothetical protein H0V27_05915 [Pyrinomonadaceae bacterium]|nr:hypothetical protein [Pyrinomonadaceae bacterium]